jgi:cbb3-type cytochrome oxidase maturation protein
MDVILYLIPAVLCVGLCGLGALFWAIRSGQYEDLDGAAQRILFDDYDKKPKVD